MDVTIEQSAFAYRACTRTLFYCARERAYYLLSTDPRGESMAFPCRSTGKVIDFGAELYAVKGVSHEEAVRGFLAADPAVIAAKLEKSLTY